MFAKKHAGLFAAAAALAFAVLAGGSAHAQDLSDPSGNWGGSYKASLKNSQEVFRSHINIQDGGGGDWDGYPIQNPTPINSIDDGTVVGWRWEHFRGGRFYEVTMWGQGTVDGNPAVSVDYVVHSGKKSGPVLYAGKGIFVLNGTGDPPGRVPAAPMDH